MSGTNGRRGRPAQQLQRCTPHIAVAHAPDRPDAAPGDHRCRGDGASTQRVGPKPKTDCRKNHGKTPYLHRGEKSPATGRSRCRARQPREAAAHWIVMQFPPEFKVRPGCGESTGNAPDGRSMPVLASTCGDVSLEGTARAEPARHVLTAHLPRVDRPVLREMSHYARPTMVIACPGHR